MLKILEENRTSLFGGSPLCCLFGTPGHGSSRTALESDTRHTACDKETPSLLLVFCLLRSDFSFITVVPLLPNHLRLKLWKG